ncbi:MAG TPA: hypothetical protein VK465_03695, partial [Fibrobacteria bacterium]|nr:hypothetical protein [Fibrobacteria bacterium]
MKTTTCSIRSVLFLGLFGLFTAASQAFPVSGTLTSANSNWSGEMEVKGDVIVPAGVTLNIAAGTRIRGEYRITANGPVKAVGTVASPVIVFATSLVLNKASGQHGLQFVTIQNSAANAVSIINADARLSHVLISDFKVNGIHIIGAEAKAFLEHVTVGAKSRLFSSDDAFSVNIEGSGDVTITNSILGFENKPNQVGLAIRGGGISNTVKVRYTLITGARIGSSAGEVGIITGRNPDVKDIPNGDYHLWPYSVAIDAGDPASTAALASEPSPNGGRVDLGYYGGTAQAESFLFQIVTPNGGDALTPGQNATIRWLGGEGRGDKKIDLSVDSGRTWSPVTPAANDAGTYTWMVPGNLKSPFCLIRLSAAGNVGLDISDRVFTIGDTVAPGNVITPVRNPTAFRCIPFAAYHDGQGPGWAEPSEDQVRSDLELIKPYTREVRTYGSGVGSHGNSIPRIAAKLGMSVHLGIWLDDTYPEATNQQSIRDAIALIQAGDGSIKSVIVGNEFLLRVRQDHKDEALAEAKLVRYIKQVQAVVPDNIPVTTGESYPDWLHASDSLFDAVDVVYWHVHPWWEQKPIENAASHAYSVYNQMKERIARTATPGKRHLLAETGWPSDATTGLAVGSEANQARYLKELHAWAHKEKFEY